MSSKHPSIVKRLEHLANSKPHKPAFIFVDRSLERRVLSRQQVWDYCRKYAAVLERKGLGKGNVICNTLPNCPQRIIIDLGIIVSGAIAMSGQMSMVDASDLVNALNVTKASSIIVDPDDTTKGVFSILKPKLDHFDPKSGEASCPDIPSLKYILTYPLATGNGHKTLMDDLDEENEMFYEDIDPGDVCQYLCTSGSTSTYKVVAFTSQMLIEFGVHFGGTMGAKEEDVFMNSRPLGWLAGYMSVYLAYGVTRLLYDESDGRLEKNWECHWKMMCQEKCDILFTDPHSLTDFSLIREESKNPEINSYKLKHIMTGGGPTSTSQIQASLKHLTEEHGIVYGSTETGVIASFSMKRPKECEEFCVGRPRTGGQLKVIDADGKEVPCGQIGEILVQTTQTASHYVNEPEKTSEVFLPDGWVRLGDIGKVNARGEVFVIGRDKFAIFRGLNVVYPHIIESVIQGCPGVKQVIVTGVPDENLFDEVCAVIIKTPGVQLSKKEVITYFDSQIIKNDVVPSPRYILFVDSFPLNSNGKCDRNMVKKQACKRLGLNLRT